MGALKYQRAHTATEAYARAAAERQEQRHQHQVAALAQLDCLRAVPEATLLQLAPLCTLRAFVPGTVILSERAVNAFVYLLLRGTVSLTLRDRTGHAVLIGVLNRGDCFGEGPLFGDLFRGATAHAETTCYLLQLPLDVVGNLLAQSPELAEALRSTYRQRLIDSTLGRVPLFCDMSPLERANIAALLQPQLFERGALIIREGEPGSALYLIESGQVAVERGGQTIAYLDEGTFFGEMSLLTKQPHNADIRALTPVEVLALPRAALLQLFDRQPQLEGQLRSVVEQRRVAGAHVQHDRTSAARIASAVDHGLMRGTHLIVRDPQLCAPGCRVCSDACSSRHGQARLRFGEVRVDDLDIIDSCRQCRVGAECVEVCPEHAIQWNDRGALVVSSACTGCGRCVEACPYDAVQLMDRAPAQRGPLWSLWQRLRRPSLPTIPLEAAQPTAVASKCDLCHGHDDLACVSACPTGALRLVPVNELFPL